MRFEKAVAFVGKREDCGQSPRRVEIIVHGLDKTGAHGLARLVKLGGIALGVLGGVFRGPAQVAHGRAQVTIRRVGLGETRIGEIERRAIVRLQHEQAQGAGIASFENVLEQQEVAQAL